MLTLGLRAWFGEASGMPNLRAVSLAVPGISCIRPMAPTPARASDMKELSWRVMANTQLECRPPTFACWVRAEREAMGKPMSHSSQHWGRQTVGLAGQYHC